jgi:hypothetical protein
MCVLRETAFVRKKMKRCIKGQWKSIHLDSELIGRLDRVAIQIDAIDPEIRKFERVYPRSRISTAELAHRCLEIGIKQVCEDEGISVPE